MRTHERILAAAALCVALGGCTTVQATYRGAVAYNRAFNQARNEILLLNVLRAREGYPQQYSTISQVVGSMRADMKVTPTLTNVIADAADAAFALGTGGELGFRNPAVTIAPLETKEFRQGMMKPIGIDFVDQLLAQGWNRDVVLHLVVGGIGCGDQPPRMNTGAVATDVDAFVQLSRGANWDLSETDATVIRRVTVPAAEGTKMLREGVGEGLTVEPVPVSGDTASPTMELVIKSKAKPVVIGLPAVAGCAAVTDPSQVYLRSPGGMIQYLGAILRTEAGASAKTAFFNVQPGRPTSAYSAIVQTTFNRRPYYIDVKDRPTLETLAVLAEIIGFQTTDASLNASKPAVTISQ